MFLSKKIFIVSQTYYYLRVATVISFFFVRLFIFNSTLYCPPRHKKTSAITCKGVNLLVVVKIFELPTHNLGIPEHQLQIL